MGTLEIVFLALWAFFTLLYWSHYRKDENIGGAAAKVAGLLAFIYGVIVGIDALSTWASAEVPAEERYALFGEITEAGPRSTLLANAALGFAIAVLLLITWYARGKFTTACSLVLSTWDRGNWYMMPSLFVLMTIGLLLVAAAASPVLSPFIYTLF